MNPVDAPDASNRIANDAAARLGRTIESLLADLPASEAIALRLGGIPHRLSPALLRHLLGVTQGREQAATLNLEALWAQAAAFRLAQADETGALVYRANVRAYLARWWQTADPQRFIAANRAALNYFQSTQAQPDKPSDPSTFPDIVYHGLVIDETAARAYLAEHFEEACDRRQYALAEHLTHYANERFNALTHESQQWVRYYQARIDLLYGQPLRAYAVLEALVQDQSTPEVSAVAQWSLGQQLIGQQQWSQALRLFKTSLSKLRSSAFYRARVMMAMGDAYANLASATGGLDLVHEPTQSTPHRVRTALLLLPFFLYKWLVHYVDLLPNWYFGGNYQNWIIADLLLQASAWYRRAAREAQKFLSPLSLVEAQLTLASIDQQLGRWRRAHRQFAQLSQNEAVRLSQYRLTRLRLNQGLAWLIEQRYQKARPALLDVRERFRSFEETRSVGFASQSLGRLYAAQKQFDLAVDAIVDSIDNYRQIGDSRHATQALADAESWFSYYLLSADLRQQLTTASDSLDELHYICRFPNSFLRFFRRLALYLAIPVTYLFVFLVIFITSVGPVLIVQVMFFFALMGSDQPAIIVHDLVLVVVILLAPAILVWIYHFIYTFAGFVFVQLWGRNIASIEQEQPNQIILTDKQLVYRDVNHRREVVILWSEITHLLIAEYCWRTQVIQLFSRLMLADSNGKTIVIDAVTSNYAHLRRELTRRRDIAGGDVHALALGMVIFKPRWLIMTGLLASGVIAWHGIEPGIFDIPNANGTPVRINLWLTNFPWQFLGTWLLFFVNVTLWRLLYRRHHQHIATPALPPVISTWLLWIIATLHLLFSIFLLRGAF